MIPVIVANKSFNSIKVQLRRKPLYDRFLTDFFQFHKGTIKAQCDGRRLV